MISCQQQQQQRHAAFHAPFSGFIWWGVKLSSSISQASHVNQRMGVLVSLQDIFEEWTWSCQDDLVCLHLLTILTGKGDISEVLVLPQLSKGWADILLEVIPLQIKFFWVVHVLPDWNVWFSFQPDRSHKSSLHYVSPTVLFCLFMTTSYDPKPLLEIV